MRPSESVENVEREAARAMITWFRFEEGGRRELPRVPLYRSVVRFDEDPNRRLGAWDFEVQFEDPPSHERSSVATVSFLAEGAPSQLLHVGSRFELTEGRKVVARGEIIQAKVSE